jgi:crossover junction endodeoxyribonuclease RuvC
MPHEVNCAAKIAVFPKKQAIFAINFNRMKEKIILGIDPGTTVMGYGLIKVVNNKPFLLAMGVLELNKYEDHYLRLQRIFERVAGLIDEFLPEELAIEAPFFGKNVQSMLKLGRAQGVAMAAALSRKIPIFEYAPLKIKMAITGNGGAAKEQVADMLQRYLKIPQENMLPQLDATDGLAAALCHFFQSNRPSANTQYTSWKDFINKNEKRVKKN